MATTKTTTTDPNPDETDLDVDAEDIDAGEGVDEGEGEGEGEGEELTEAQLQEKLDQAEQELQKTRRALKKANREAAARRVALKAQKGAKDEGEGDAEGENPLEAEVARLKEEIKQRDHRTFIEKEKSRVHAFAAELGFKYPEDALTLGGLEFDDDEPLDDEEIKTAVRALARKRPELLQTKEIIDADSQRRGKRDSLLIDEEAIARQFGVRNFVPSKKE